MAHAEKCPVCMGTGKHENRECHGCKGLGWVTVGVDYPPPQPEPIYPEPWPIYPEPYRPTMLISDGCGYISCVATADGITHPI